MPQSRWTFILRIWAEPASSLREQSVRGTLQDVDTEEIAVFGSTRQLQALVDAHLRRDAAAGSTTGDDEDGPEIGPCTLSHPAEMEGGDA